MKKIWTLCFLVYSGVLFADPLMDSYTQEYNKEYAKALVTMEELSKNNPNDYFTQLRTGWVALVKGDYTKSSQYYKKAILLAPNAIEPRIGNVRAVLAMGNYKQVDVDCRTILKQDSKNYFARSTLAYANYVLANYKEAEKYYESITNDFPADTEMLIGLGWSQLKQGNKAKAKQVFAFLLKIIPNEERVTSGHYYANN
ncbi:MAG: tetratricopeptide repeat protein [Leptospiraceae bacterium]|nr:tetratricopeptide repeat protein [Leptospiraceae bacterium]